MHIDRCEYQRQGKEKLHSAILSELCQMSRNVMARVTGFEPAMIPLTTESPSQRSPRA